MVRALRKNSSTADEEYQTMGKVTFGVQIEPQFGFTYDHILEIAKICERNGFSNLWASDHFYLSEEVATNECLECWTLLSALARDTQTLRIGQLVSCNSYRHPSLVAKMAACVDVLSNGRLDFGYGAGWKQIEYNAYGYPFPSPRERIDRLREAVTIAKLMWTQERASFSGRYYRIERAPCYPRPVQKPHPPIWIGGIKDRIMAVAATHADGVNFSEFLITYQRYLERASFVKKKAKASGRDPSSLKFSIVRVAVVGESLSEVEELLKEEAARRKVAVEDLRKRWGAGALIGTPDECVQALKPFVQDGVSHMIFLLPYKREVPGVRILGNKVLPQLAQSAARGSLT